MKKYFFILLTFVMLFMGCGKQQEMGKYHIEYLNKQKDEIVKVTYEPKSSETVDLMKEFLIVLCSDSENVDYRKPIPNDVEIINYSLDGAMLTIWFDEDYNKMNAVEEVLCRAAVVRTMTQIEGIDCVTFYVGDKQLQDADGSRVLLCGVPIAVGVAAYVVGIVLFKTIKREDCLLLPKGEKIAKLLKL